jgi:hypothetical protein
MADLSLADRQSSWQASSCQALAQGPQLVSGFRIDGPRPDTMRLRMEFRGYTGDIAVLTIHSAQPIELQARGTPHACRGTLLHSLHPASRIDDGPAFVVDRTLRSDLLRRHVLGQIRENASRVYGEPANAVSLTESIKLQSKQNIGSF